MTRDDAVREVVFRYQFAHNDAALIDMRRATAFYLSVGVEAADPSDDLIRRFVGMVPPVKTVSQCMVDPGQNVVDKETRKRGVIFSLTALTWQSATEVTVEGGYYDDNHSAAGHTYRVVRRNGQWVVADDTEHWTAS